MQSLICKFGTFSDVSLETVVVLSERLQVTALTVYLHHEKLSKVHLILAIWLTSLKYEELVRSLAASLQLDAGLELSSQLTRSADADPARLHLLGVGLLQLFIQVRKTEFGTRFDFNADPDPAFYGSADPDPDPKFWWPKIGKNLKLKKILKVFDKKLHVTLVLGRGGGIVCLAVLRIRDIMVWIRLRILLIGIVFCLLPFEATFTSFFIERKP